MKTSNEYKSLMKYEIEEDIKRENIVNLIKAKG